MSYPSYLVHFNKNHDKLGRFTFSSKKDLYKSIKEDAKTGDFKLKNYRQSDYIKDRFDKSELRELKKKDIDLRNDYDIKQKEIKAYNKLRDEENKAINELAKKYYDESKKPNMTEDEKFDLWEDSLDRADLVILKDPKYSDKGKIDYSKMHKSVTWDDIMQVTGLYEDEIKKVVNDLIGEYGEMHVKSSYGHDRLARDYVDAIIRTMD